MPVLNIFFKGNLLEGQKDRAAKLPVGCDSTRGGPAQAEISRSAGQGQRARLINGADADAVALVVCVLAAIVVETFDHPGTARVEILEAAPRSLRRIG